MPKMSQGGIQDLMFQGPDAMDKLFADYDKGIALFAKAAELATNNVDKAMALDKKCNMAIPYIVYKSAILQ